MAQQQYTAKKGSYSRNELRLLATSLGFPGSLLVSRFHPQHSQTEDAADGEEVVSERAISQLLGSGALFKTLEKVFNRYPAWYNVKSFRKATQHIRHHTLSFADVAQCRVVFQLYAEEDGSGVPAEFARVQLALKMLERVCSPSRLQLEIQRFSDVSDVPSRLQLYEFMDIVALCQKTEVEDERRLSELSLSGTTLSGESGTSLLNDPESVVDFDQILMTRDEKVRAYLEDNYQQTLHGKNKSTEPTHTRSSPEPALMKDHIVHTDSRKSLVSLGSRQYRAVSPCLEESQYQLHGSRCGFHTLSSNIHLPSWPGSPPKSRLSNPPPKTPSISHSALSPDMKSINPHSSKWMRSRAPSTDPLLSQGLTTDSRRGSKPVRVRLQHKKSKFPLYTKTPDAGATQVSEELEEEISDICSDSVLKARQTLVSSLSAIPPPIHIASPQSICNEQANNTSGQRPVTVGAVPVSRQTASRCGRMRSQFYLQPIVSCEEKEDQQFLIDSLLWSSRRSKKHYQVIK